MNEYVTFDECAVSLGVMTGEFVRRPVDTSLEVGYDLMTFGF